MPLWSVIMINTNYLVVMLFACASAARPGHKPSTSSMGMGVMIGGKSMLDELRKKQQGGSGAAGGVAGLRPTAHAGMYLSFLYGVWCVCACVCVC